MKKTLLFRSSYLILGALCLSGCTTMMSGLWEETKTLSRYISRTGRSLFDQNTESRLVASNEEFYARQYEEFIPLRDEDLDTQGRFVETSIPQPKDSPGTSDSSLPGIEAFKNPGANLQSIFHIIHFQTDQHTLMHTEQRTWIEKMAVYMKKNPSIYLFVQGHCDERASESYNLALGTRRANHIRYLLIKYGANPNNIYTISYGKERPCDYGHTKSAWAKNRRVEFKLYDKKVSL